MDLIRSLATVVLALGLAAGPARAAPAATDAPVVLIATDDEKRGGYLVEISEAVWQRAGFRPRIRYLPWKRALAKSLNAEFDMLLGAYYTEARARRMLYSQPIAKVELCLLKRKTDDIRFATLTDLKPYRIGHIRGAAVSPAFDQAAQGELTVEYVGNIEFNIRKLLAGRIDLVLDKKWLLLHLIRTKYPDAVDRVEVLSPPLNTSYFYNAFPRNRPRHAELAAIFDRGLTAIRQDGTMAAILARHGLSPEAP